MEEKIAIQDDKREKELIKLFRLEKKIHSRIGIDASLIYNKNKYDFEIKSTTMGEVSTASPLHLTHIEKWRHQYWIIGVYDKNANLTCCKIGSPRDMKEWLDYWENDIKRGLKISDMLVERIDMKMLDSIFGKKMYYSITEAKKVFKKLKTKSEYEELDYKGNGIKRRDMLDLFKQHNKNYLYRGSAVNNPKIPESYYKNWHTIEKNHHIEIRKFLKG